MKTSKQIDKEYVTIASTIPIDLYFRLKFSAEEAGYRDMSSYVKDLLLGHFVEDGYKEAK